MKKMWEQLKPQERRLVIGIGCLVFLIMNYFFVWPKFGEWRRNSARMAAAHKKIADCQVELSKKSSYEAKIKEFYAAGQEVPAPEMAGQFQKFFLDRAADNGVAIENTSKITSSTTEFFMEQRATIQVVTLESNLVNFLYSLGSSSSLMRVKTMSLHVPEPRYQLRASLTIVASYQKAKTPAPATHAAAPAAPSVPKPPASPTNTSFVTNKLGTPKH